MRRSFSGCDTTGAAPTSNVTRSRDEPAEMSKEPDEREVEPPTARHGRAADVPRRPLPAKVRHPRHPDRICQGGDKCCPADVRRRGNGTIRTRHPAELFGDDWEG